VSGAILALAPRVGAEETDHPLVRAAPARPSDATEDARDQTKERRDRKGDIPIVAYAYAADGAPEKTVGAYGYGLGLAASGQDNALGGGVTVWGSPIDRLTLIGDAPSDLSGRFTPSVALIGRILGGRKAGYALGALAKWKAEGFGVGPHGDEIESEIEGGALFSLEKSKVHLDANGLFGGGTGPAGEMDAEARLRLGYDVHRLVWLGIDGQARIRVAGPKTLPNGRIWDFAAGPQVLVGASHFFGSLTAGPTTMRLVTDAVGFSAMVSLGGAM
jgi:hypothetical protein